jgi:hypothetical protein
MWMAPELFHAEGLANMNREPISKVQYFTPEQIAAAIAAAPEHVDDPDCPYDPNDEAAVDAYWANAKLIMPGEHLFQKTSREK